MEKHGWLYCNESLPESGTKEKYPKHEECANGWFCDSGFEDDDC